jgi:RNA-directed DNA polymerase
MIIARYADDIVDGFGHKRCVRRFWDAMRERLGAYAWRRHPEETRLIAFGRFAADRRARRGLGKPETFPFLGFTVISGKSLGGKFLIHRRTRSDCLRARPQAIKAEFRKRMHQSIPDQGKWLAHGVKGYCAYHAAPANMSALAAFRHHVGSLWLRTLRRRSQKDRLPWRRLQRLVDDRLPKPRILHPWPALRFAVKHARSAACA